MSLVQNLLQPGLGYLAGVVTLEYDPSRCNGCRTCVQVCPHGVLEMHAKRARVIDRDACMECGACALNCPEQALTVQSGVGCAAAIITGAVRGTEPTCDCGTDDGDVPCC